MHTVISNLGLSRVIGMESDRGAVILVNSRRGVGK